MGSAKFDLPPVAKHKYSSISYASVDRCRWGWGRWMAYIGIPGKTRVVSNVRFGDLQKVFRCKSRLNWKIDRKSISKIHWKICRKIHRKFSLKIHRKFSRKINRKFNWKRDTGYSTGKLIFFFQIFILHYKLFYEKIFTIILFYKQFTFKLSEYQSQFSWEHLSIPSSITGSDFDFSLIFSDTYSVKNDVERKRMNWYSNT